MNRSLGFSDLRDHLSGYSDDAFRSRSGATTLVLYSGRRGQNRALAANAVASAPNEKFSIHETEVGQYLDGLDLYGPDSGIDRHEASELWALASKKVIENSLGDIETFVIDAKFDRTFRDVELPSALSNENFKRLNGKSRDQFAAINSPVATFEAICKSEFELDDARLAQLTSPNLKESFHERKTIFERWQSEREAVKNAFALSADEILEAEIAQELGQSENYDFGQGIGLSQGNEI